MECLRHNSKSPMLACFQSEDVGQLLATAQRMHDRGYLEYTKALQSSELSSALAPSALELGSLSQVNFPRFQADFRIAALVTFASEKVLGNGVQRFAALWLRRSDVVAVR